MSNDVKRTDLTPRQWSARLTLLMCLGVLAVLVTQLPHPAQVVGALTGSDRSPIEVVAPLAAVQSILLMTAGLLAWLLVGWALAVVVVGLIARLPGSSGRRARRLLPGIAPASVGRLVAAAVGVSLIAGTAACAAPAGPSTAAGAPAATSTAPPSAAPSPATGDGDPGGSITIDWPDPTPTPPDTASTVPSSPASSDQASSDPASSSPAISDPATSDATPPEPPAPELLSTEPQSPEPQSPEPFESDVAPNPEPVTGAPVTVQPGDSLWRIAATSQGPDASDADIDNAWRAWYFTNQQVIGDDPDLIVPGQTLVAPASAGQVRS